MEPETSRWLVATSLKCDYRLRERHGRLLIAQGRVTKSEKDCCPACIGSEGHSNASYIVITPAFVVAELGQFVALC